jgi:hypothetical protein
MFYSKRQYLPKRCKKIAEQKEVAERVNKFKGLNRKIFDVRWMDPKLFIAVGAIIVIRAIIPGAIYLTTPHKKLPEPVAESLSPTSEDAKVIFSKEPDGVIFTSAVDNTQLQSEKLEFPGLGKITTKKVKGEMGGDEVIASFPDFRTIRLKKTEISQLYKALLESEVKFFQPGKWEIMIKVNKK